MAKVRMFPVRKQDWIGLVRGAGKNGETTKLHAQQVCDVRASPFRRTISMPQPCPG